VGYNNYVWGGKMDNIEFKSKEELYKRILPALKSQRKRLTYDGFGYITEEQIWNYLKKNTWAHTRGLELCDMVKDIMNVDSLEINKYYFNEYMKNK
jgi:hypothetical protein